MAAKRVQFNVRIDPDLAAAAILAAGEMELSQAEYVEYLLRLYVPLRLLRQARRDVPAGQQPLPTSEGGNGQ